MPSDRASWASEILSPGSNSPDVMAWTILATASSTSDEIEMGLSADKVPHPPIRPQFAKVTPGHAPGHNIENAHGIRPASSPRSPSTAGAIWQTPEQSHPATP